MMQRGFRQIHSNPRPTQRRLGVSVCLRVLVEAERNSIVPASESTPTPCPCNVALVSEPMQRHRSDATKNWSTVPATWRSAAMRQTRLREIDFSIPSGDGDG
jgi:hypothetical protein